MLVRFTRVLPSSHEPQFAVNADNVSWVMKSYRINPASPDHETTDIVTSDSLDVVTVVGSFDSVFEALQQVLGK